MTLLSLADVGDGLCGRLLTAPNTSVQVDCGSQQGGEYAMRGWLRLNDRLPNPLFCWAPDEMIISHYHADHYNGVLWAASRSSGWYPETPVRALYAPGLPEVPQRGTLLRAWLAVSTLIAGAKSGHIGADLVHALKVLNGGRSVRFRQLFAGESLVLGNLVLDVLWPPRRVDAGLTRQVNNAVALFNEAKARHPALAQLDERLANGELARAVLEEADQTHRDQSDAQGWRIENFPDGIPDDVNQANDALRGVANQLSLAFRIDSRTLFLGDIPGAQLKHIASKSVADGVISFETGIAAHHGTQWHKELTRLRVDKLLVSNGPRLIRHYRPEWRLTARRVEMTMLSGDLSV